MGEFRSASVRPITSAEAAAAAEIVQLVRERPNDRIDPWPPCREFDVLLDAGARGKGPEVHPLIAVDKTDVQERVVGYGAVDVSPEINYIQLVGPVIHPAYRRRGFGKALVEGMLEQGRAARGVKHARIQVSSQNGAAQELLPALGFKQKKIYTCLRLKKPEAFPELALPGIDVRRVDEKEDKAVHEFTKRLMPRPKKQTRALLKSEEYVAVVAYRKGEIVGIAELDLRFGKVGTIEHIDGVPSLIQKGLGAVLIANLMPIVFNDAGGEFIEMMIAGTEREQMKAYAAAGFKKSAELFGFERKL
ncbi:MAG: GNAT family N-acetyltransferase [Planctomycetota bacterium]